MDCKLDMASACSSETVDYASYIHDCGALTRISSLSETGICDRIWENPAYSEFYESLVSYKFDKLYHRANPTSKFRTDRTLRVGARALCL